MKRATVGLIEKLLYQKIMLYNDLLHCFMEERESLISIDMDKLWRLSREKGEICEKITSTRQEIIFAAHREFDQEFTNLKQVMDLIPEDCSVKFQHLYLKILKLKGEIEILRKQNILYIDDSLEFMDEMISILTGENESRYIYNDRCHFKPSGPRLFLNREV